MRIDDDMMFDLAKAVFADDLDGAKDALCMIRAVSGDATVSVLIKAREAVHPLPPAPSVNPMPLPMPGHAVGSTLGRPLEHRPAA